jgi:hypothetical protein
LSSLMGAFRPGPCLSARYPIHPGLPRHEWDNTNLNTSNLVIQTTQNGVNEAKDPQLF